MVSPSVRGSRYAGPANDQYAADLHVLMGANSEISSILLKLGFVVKPGPQPGQTLVPIAALSYLALTAAAPITDQAVRDLKFFEHILTPVAAMRLAELAEPQLASALAIYDSEGRAGLSKETMQHIVRAAAATVVSPHRTLKVDDFELVEAFGAGQGVPYASALDSVGTVSLGHLIDVGGNDLCAALAAAAGPWGRRADRAPDSPIHKLLIFLEQLLPPDTDDDAVDEVVADALQPMGHALQLFPAVVSKLGHFKKVAKFGEGLASAATQANAIRRNLPVILLRYQNMAQVLRGADDGFGLLQRLNVGLTGSPDITLAAISAMDEAVKGTPLLHPRRGLSAGAAVDKFVADRKQGEMQITNIMAGSGGAGSTAVSGSVAKQMAAEQSKMYETPEYEELAAFVAAISDPLAVLRRLAVDPPQYVARALIENKAPAMCPVSKAAVAAAAHAAAVLETLLMAGTLDHGSSEHDGESDEAEEPGKSDDGGTAKFGLERLRVSTKNAACLMQKRFTEVDISFILYQIFTAKVLHAADTFTKVVPFSEIPEPLVNVLPYLEILFVVGGVPADKVSILLACIEDLCSRMLDTPERQALIAELVNDACHDWERNFKSAAAQERNAGKVSVDVSAIERKYENTDKLILSRLRAQQLKRREVTFSPLKSGRRTETASLSPPTSKPKPGPAPQPAAAAKATPAALGAQAPSGKKLKPGLKLNTVRISRSKDLIAIGKGYVYDLAKIRSDAMSKGSTQAQADALNEVAAAFLVSDGRANTSQRRAYVNPTKTGKDVADPFVGFKATDYLLINKKQSDYPRDF